MDARRCVSLADKLSFLISESIDSKSREPGRVSCVPLGHTQLSLLQRGFDYTHENKWKPLFAANGKFHYTPSAKDDAVAYEKKHCCLKS
jgi:hypothetical protein